MISLLQGPRRWVCMKCTGYIAVEVGGTNRLESRNMETFGRQQDRKNSRPKLGTHKRFLSTTFGHDMSIGCFAARCCADYGWCETLLITELLYQYKQHVAGDIWYVFGPLGSPVIDLQQTRPVTYCAFLDLLPSTFTPT